MAWDLHVGFYIEAKELWHSGTCQDSFVNLAALRLMDYTGASGGFDLEARYFNQCTFEMASRLGLHDDDFQAGDSSLHISTSDDTRFRNHAAWGYFASTS